MQAFQLLFKQRFYNGWSPFLRISRAWSICRDKYDMYYLLDIVDKIMYKEHTLNAHITSNKASASAMQYSTNLSVSDDQWRGKSDDVPVCGLGQQT